MPKPETITMTMRELDRLKVIQAVVDQGLAVWRAAEKLGLSRRQVERLVRVGSKLKSRFLVYANLFYPGKQFSWVESPLPLILRATGLRKKPLPRQQLHNIMKPIMLKSYSIFSALRPAGTNPSIFMVTVCSGIYFSSRT